MAPDPEIACPRCASTDIVPILYGFWDAEMVAAEERGEVLLGGCVIQPDSPASVCRRCGVTVSLLETTVPSGERGAP